MKKGLVILIAVCYMFCAFGISLAFHYCSGELKRISLVPDPNDKGCCETMKKHKCCHDKIVKAEKQDHRAISKFFIKHTTVQQLEPVLHPFAIASPVPAYRNTVINFHLRPPPLIRGGVPLYLLNSVFRI